MLELGISRSSNGLLAFRGRAYCLFCSSLLLTLSLWLGFFFFFSTFSFTHDVLQYCCFNPVPDPGQSKLKLSINAWLFLFRAFSEILFWVSLFNLSGFFRLLLLSHYGSPCSLNIIDPGDWRLVLHSLSVFYLSCSPIPRTRCSHRLETLPPAEIKRPFRRSSVHRQNKSLWKFPRVCLTHLTLRSSLSGFGILPGGSSSRLCISISFIRVPRPFYRLDSLYLSMTWIIN